MASFILSATLTTAGSALIATAKANGTKIKVTKAVFGDATANPTASSTGVGGVVEETSLVLAGTNLSQTRAEIHAAFIGGVSAKAGTIGFYVDTTLLCLVKFTLPAAGTSTQARTQIIARFEAANASVFSQQNRTVISTTHISELWKDGYEEILKVYGGSQITTGSTPIGTAAGTNVMAQFINHYNIVETDADLATYAAKYTSFEYYDLRTWSKMQYSNGVITTLTGTLNDVLVIGLFYFAIGSRRLYYARGLNDLLKVNNPAQILALECRTNNNTVANKHAYTTISNLSVPIVAGDKLLYSVTGSDGIGVDCLISGSESPLRSTTITDQNAISAHPAAVFGSRITKKWYDRVIDLSPLAGNSLSQWAIAGERDEANITYTGYFKDIRVVNSAGVVKAIILRDDLQIKDNTVPTHATVTETTILKKRFVSQLEFDSSMEWLF